jgi:dTDP-4-amino-4,6-dideoxygalactose transaminase
MFYVQFLKTEEAHYFRTKMNQLDVSTATHYQPLSSSSFGKKYSTKPFYANESEQAANNLVRLPVWFNLSELLSDSIFDAASAVLKTIGMDSLN